MKLNVSVKTVRAMQDILFYLALLCFSLIILCSLAPKAHAGFNEDFGGPGIASEWGVKSEHMRMLTDWKHSVSRSSLNVTEVKDRSVNKDWSTVTMSRTFNPLTDFNADIAFGWDIGKGKKNVKAVQKFNVMLYDIDDNLISSFGYNDTSMSKTGSIFAQAGGSSKSQKVKGSSGKETFTLTRSGDELSVMWDGKQIITGQAAGDLERIEVSFSHNNMKKKKELSYFGTESVDHIFVSGTSAGIGGSAPPVAPEPVSSALFIAGGVLLAGRRYLKRNN